MIKLKQLHVENVISHKDTTFNLDQTGLSTVYGDNGAGKSVVFRQIPMLRYRTSVIDTGKKKVRAAFNEESKVSLDFTLTHADKQNDYSYICKAGKEYDILRNGKPSKIRTQNYAARAIDKLFPISEEEFYALYYIDARRNSLLQLGKDASRLKFFTQMFHLEDFDNLNIVKH